MNKCRKCKEDIKDEAAKCKHCGTDLRNWFMRHKIMTVIAVLFVIGLIGSILGSGDNTSSKPEAGFVMPSFGEQIVTYDEYQQIQNGMSYADVTSVIGAMGEEVSRNRIEGIAGVMESVDTVMYQWMNSSGSNMNAMFQNDKLFQKAQFGLQ